MLIKLLQCRVISMWRPSDGHFRFNCPRRTLRISLERNAIVCTSICTPRIHKIYILKRASGRICMRAYAVAAASNKPWAQLRAPEVPRSEKRSPSMFLFFFFLDFHLVLKPIITDEKFPFGNFVQTGSSLPSEFYQCTGNIFKKFRRPSILRNLGDYKWENLIYKLFLSSRYLSFVRISCGKLKNAKLRGT